MGDKKTILDLDVEIESLRAQVYVKDNLIRLKNEEIEGLEDTITACEEQVSLVYCHITNQRISKMNTMAFEVIGEHDAICGEELERQSAIIQTCKEALKWYARTKMLNHRVARETLSAIKEIDNG
jgi:hypothetical protein